ncbi:GNAT family N-acetyltransferase [Lentzea flava]|uniref:N-acetyltransferase n=1 Tax=Lentzea flava TaxID=103732 RepID=A0ABQ2V479_9PSEU|nr:GNAT family protein [Lentzea flava]MCP2203469.1 Protein N-acetyltransferase, RimJ/RimL family [Lentzea flava]GGU67717.1 N-acetyltransferase [Lentzea flava]
MRPDYPLKTERLLLRPFEERDLDDFFAYRARPDVQRYLFTEVPDRAACAELLARRMTEDELTEEGQRLALAVYWPEARRVVGDVVLKWLSETDRQGEIGYGFNPEFQGKGLATEAAGAMLKLGFEGLGLHRIIAQCDPRNEPSWRLMERLGMRREAHFRDFGILKGEWGDLYVYAMLAEEYRTLK